MYICNSCGAVCDCPATYREYHGFRYGGYEEFFVDCECGGEWEEASYCVSCGLPFCEFELTLSDDGWVCSECYQDEELDVTSLPDVRQILAKATK